MKTIQLDPPHPTTIPNQFRIDMPPSIGKGGFDILSFGSGLRFVVLESTFEQPVLIRNSMNKSTVGFGFCLAGQFEARADCFKTPFAIRTGESGFFTCPRPMDIFEKIENRLHRAYLMLESDYLLTMAHGDEDRFYSVLKSLGKKTFCRSANATTPVMKAILHQMLHCPYHGMTRRIFLEGKAMELLAQKLEQLYPGGASHASTPKSSETERVRRAAHLLVHDLENPPDITTLANSTGLSRTKLFSGFRRTFGLSPLEFLRNQRLQMAMQLLQAGEANVTQASLMVGYTNLSYFAKAFKSMFGIPPGELCRPSAPSPPE